MLVFKYNVSYIIFIQFNASSGLYHRLDLPALTISHHQLKTATFISLVYNLRDLIFYHFLSSLFSEQRS